MRYTIPQPNLNELVEKLEKLEKRAQKLAVIPITFEVIDIKEEDKDGRIYRQFIVEVIGESPKLNGWKFAAKLEHLSEGNIIRSLVNFDLPERFRTLEPNCEYCHKMRNRKNTYVVYNDNNEFIQVGSSCLKDFTGHADPHAVAKSLEILIEIQQLCSKSEDYIRDRFYGASVIRLETYLAYTSIAIRTNGYVSTKNAGVEGSSTKDMALNLMFRNRDHQIPSKKDCQIAEATISFVRNTISVKRTKSEYEWNLERIFANGNLKFSHCGYAASAVIVYMKQMERNTEFANSQYMGQVKKRQIFSGLKCVNIIYIEGYYGTTMLHKFVDENGNLMVWFSSSKELEPGKTYTGKATVKEHKEYRGTKQTVLTRCAFKLYS